MRNKTHIHVSRNLAWNGVDLYVIEEGRDHFAVAEPITMTKCDPQVAHMLDPTFRLQMEDAQAFMDELWNAGLRPTDAKDKSEA